MHSILKLYILHIFRLKRKVEIAHQVQNKLRTFNANTGDLLIFIYNECGEQEKLGLLILALLYLGHFLGPEN